jgi:2-oxoglutarate ferredoxin oxidoreductase subunit alpha
VGKEFLEGNEAIARGAIKAGCDFFAGYPITPSSSILHYMLDWLPHNGGIGIQAEDEIASVGLCIGAAMAGRKALTATSGPGISLYSENIGLAIMGETPIVIVNVQRQGPATGSATKGAEGDVQFTRWVTSGGMPVIALSPASVAEAYELTYLAFNYAEKYRTPVFVLTNKEIGVTRESVDLNAIELPPRVDRVKAGLRDDYRPHCFEKPADVPPMSDFGGPNIARYTTSTHDKNAYLTASPPVIQEMIDHYKAKIDEAADDIALYKEDFQEGAVTVIISYGITSRSATVAVEKARKDGKKVSALTLQTLFPVPEKAIRNALQNIRKVIVPEMNMGQYILEIERLACGQAEIVGVNKMDTTLISPDMILAKAGLA